MDHASSGKIGAGVKRFIIIVLAPMVLTAAAYGADDYLTRATKLYEKRHYEETASLLRPELGSMDKSKQGTANLVLGMAYFKNAQLHRELYGAAARASQDYLKKLAAAHGQARSRFVDLYLGDVLLETGKPGVAAIYLGKFSGASGVEPRYRAIAKAELGLSYYQNNEVQKAEDLWAGIEASDPEVKAELAAVYSRAGLAGKNTDGMVDESISSVKRSGKPLSMRMIKNAIAVYARTEQTDKGLDLIKRMDAKTYSYRETIGKSKIIYFYDLALLGDMATLYGQASILCLEKAAQDPKARDAAEFYLSQAYSLFGSVEKSAKIAAAFVSFSPMPQSYKDRIRVWQGANLFRKNRVMTEVVSLWDELSRKQPEDPELLAEILFNCGRLRIECTRIMQKSTALVEAGEGKKVASLNIAIGKYFLGKLDNARAVTYLEAGRDKSNKNKIESNDPEMLVDLADAYYRTKKFSESLEIYFEMSKQFPEVRQIQDAMQGVYAVEHKSAGDVKIN
jgi:tetratricopeptide (TPR) repeat protein